MLSEDALDWGQAYNRLIDEINQTEEHGDWSYTSQTRIRQLFSQQLSSDSYALNHVLCREKMCIVELLFDDIQPIIDFLDKLRREPQLCDCVPMEHLWPQRNAGNIKFVFN